MRNLNALAIALTLAITWPGAVFALDTAEPHLEKGKNLFFQKKKFKEAEEQFRAATRLEPNNYKGHMRLGQVLAAMGDLDAAILEEQKAIELSPNHHYPHVLLGKMLYQNGKADQGLTELRKAAKIKPTSFRASVSADIFFVRSSISSAWS